MWMTILTLNVNNQNVLPETQWCPSSGALVGTGPEPGYLQSSTTETLGEPSHVPLFINSFLILHSVLVLFGARVESYPRIKGFCGSGNQKLLPPKEQDLSESLSGLLGFGREQALLGHGAAFPPQRCPPACPAFHLFLIY